MPAKRDSPVFQKASDAVNDAPIKFTEVDGFSRPVELVSARSMQSINSFRSELTAPIYERQNANTIRDTAKPYVGSAGDLASPVRVSVPQSLLFTVHRSPFTTTPFLPSYFFIFFFAAARSLSKLCK